MSNEERIARGAEHALEDIAYELHLVREALQAIVVALGNPVPPKPDQVIKFTLHQKTTEGAFMPITGTVVGTTSTFNIGLVPSTNFVPLTSGPTVTVDDTNVTLGAVDASNNFTAAVAAADTATVYNVTIAGVNGAGVAISHSFAVPILPLPPPPPVQVTDFSLSQVS